MTRILCLGDVHAMDRPPASVADTYMDDIIDMLRWTVDWAAENHVDAIVWGGDVFHHKAPARTSHALVLRMIDIVKYHAAKNVPLWIVTGNHDISNDVLTSVHEKQPLGVLYAAGAHELSGWHPTLPLCGIPWQQRWQHEGAVAEAFATWRLDPPRFGQDKSAALAVTHASIFPPGEEPPYEFLNLDDIAEAMGHTGSLYYGHIHEDHGVYHHGGVTLANMGAISRGSLHEYNVTREIKAALWTDGADITTGTGGLSIPTQESYATGFTAIPIPHRPAAEHFHIVSVAEAKAEQLSLEKFLSDIGSSTLDISSTGSVIAHIQQRDDINSRIKKRAIDILESVQ